MLTSDNEIETGGQTAILVAGIRLSKKTDLADTRNGIRRVMRTVAKVR